MFRIFISASIPPPEDPICLRYPIDKQAIRDALLSILVELLPESEVIWGGHPAITRIMADIVKHQWCRDDYLSHFHLYQSSFFTTIFPEENRQFPQENLHLTPACATREESLLSMRQTMLSQTRPIDMAIFMGGRQEGLSEELRILRENHPRAIVLPLATTGGFSKYIYERSHPRSIGNNSGGVGISDELYDACKRYRYYSLFRRALQIAGGRQNS